MKLWDIVKTVGAGALNIIAPGAGTAIIGAVNEFLPDDKKLPDSATGHDVQNAIQALPPDQRATVMEKELEIDITEIKESHSTVRYMLESDTKNPHTTRPYIAKHSFHVVAFAIVASIVIWGYGVVIENDKIVEAVMDGWPFLLSVIGPLVVLLHAYFGILQKEHRQKLDSAAGTQRPSLIGTIANLIGGKKQ